MLRLLKQRSVSETLGLHLTAQQKLHYETLIPGIIRIQEIPDITLERLTGIVIPPHERTMLYIQLLGASTNVHISSRGTAKSSTVLGLSSIHRSWTRRGRNSVLLNCTGFRGGQLLYNEVQRWIEGAWDSQDSSPGFIKASIMNPKIVTRQASFWEIKFDSDSYKLVLPTNDPDRIRGVRAKDLDLDEALLATEELIEKVAKHFLTVKGDFRHGGTQAEANTVTYCSTVDYSFRPFMRYATAARESLETDWAAFLAKEKGDKARYAELTKFGFCTQTYTSFDYSDLLVRTKLTTRDGRRFKITWPNKDIPIVHLSGGLPFTERGPDGEMVMRGSSLDVYPTYPIDLATVESGLYSGAADEATWKAEQRNIADNAAGDVYAHALVDAASCVGENVIIPADRMSAEWQAQNPLLDGYVPRVMWKCNDPVVIGVDYAGGDRDFTAFTVIRVGPLAMGEFNPLTHHGHTGWSNVIWCEQHRRTSHDDVREKLYQLLERYPNIAYFHDPFQQDDWTVCRGIGLDMKGGGQGVRDALVYINDDVVPHGRFRIYDPLDSDERVRGFATDPNAKPILDAIMPSDILNDKMVEFTVGQMQQRLLYIPKYLQQSERTDGREADIAYEASKRLSQQLRKLQQEPTQRGRKFFMPGSREALEGKKDLFSSFIYAAKQLRAHLIRSQLIINTPPPTGGVVSRIGATRNQRGFHGRAIGSKTSR
jgi:hypothetical protein